MGAAPVQNERASGDWFWLTGGLETPCVPTHESIPVCRFSVICDRTDRSAEERICIVNGVLNNGAEKGKES